MVDVPSAAAVEVFVVLGFLASFFIGTDGVIPLFLAGVTGSLLGLTSPEILLSNFCCTGVDKSASSSFIASNILVGSASTDKFVGSSFNFLM